MRNGRRAVIALTAIQAIAVAGIVALQYFTTHRSGAARHITVISQQLESTVDYRILQIAAMLAISVAAVWLAWRWAGRKAHRSGGFTRELVILLIMLAVSILFFVLASRSTIRSYDYLCMLVFLIDMLQVVKTTVSSRTEKEGSSETTEVL